MNIMKKKWRTKFDKIEPVPVASKNDIFIGTIGKKRYIIKEFLRRGGLRCEVLVSGKVKVGDEIIVL